MNISPKVKHGLATLSIVLNLIAVLGYAWYLFASKSELVVNISTAVVLIDFVAGIILLVTMPDAAPHKWPVVFRAWNPLLTGSIPLMIWVIPVVNPTNVVWYAFVVALVYSVLEGYQFYKMP